MRAYQHTGRASATRGATSAGSNGASDIEPCRRWSLATPRATPGNPNQQSHVPPGGSERKHRARQYAGRYCSRRWQPPCAPPMAAHRWHRRRCNALGLPWGGWVGPRGARRCDEKRRNGRRPRTRAHVGGWVRRSVASPLWARTAASCRGEFVRWLIRCRTGAGSLTPTGTDTAPPTSTVHRGSPRRCSGRAAREAVGPGEGQWCDGRRVSRW